jgi:hypothetical protein
VPGHGQQREILGARGHHEHTTCRRRLARSSVDEGWQEVRGRGAVVGGVRVLFAGGGGVGWGAHNGLTQVQTAALFVFCSQGAGQKGNVRWGW